MPPALASGYSTVKSSLPGLAPARQQIQRARRPKSLWLYGNPGTGKSTHGHFPYRGIVGILPGGRENASIFFFATRASKNGGQPRRLSEDFSANSSNSTRSFSITSCPSIMSVG